MRISDWSSDVCASDLASSLATALPEASTRQACRARASIASVCSFTRSSWRLPMFQARPALKCHSRPSKLPIRLSCCHTSQSGVRERKSVGWGKSVSVRVDLGGRRIVKKKKNKKKTLKTISRQIQKKLNHQTNNKITLTLRQYNNIKVE